MKEARICRPNISKLLHEPDKQFNFLNSSKYPKVSNKKVRGLGN